MNYRHWIQLFLVATTIMMVVACAQPQKDPRRFHGVDAEFVPYLDLYENTYHVQIYDIPINFYNQNGNVVGLCQTWTGGWREITIDGDYWAFASELDKQFLIFHELGHCHQGRDHLEGQLEDGCPVSIMSPYTMPQWCEEQHYFHYIEELRPR